jgi:hypothetical protein
VVNVWRVILEHFADLRRQLFHKKHDQTRASAGSVFMVKRRLSLLGG